MAFVINTVTLTGTLVRDPETRALPNGDSVLTMRIAVNGRKKTQNGYEDVPGFYNVTTFNAVDWLTANLSKGMNVAVSGELRWREYTDKNQQRRESIEVIARDVIPIPRREQPAESGGWGGGGQQRDEFAQTPPPPANHQQRQPAPVPAGHADTDEIPF